MGNTGFMRYKHTEQTERPRLFAAHLVLEWFLQTKQDKVYQ